MFKKNEMMLTAEKARFKPNLALQLLIFFGFYVVIQLGAGTVAGIVAMLTIAFTNPARLSDPGALEKLSLTPTYTLISLFSLLVVIVLAIVYCRFIERRPLKSMGIRREGAVKHYLLGMLFGFLLFGTAVSIAALSGAIELSFSKTFSTLIVIFLFAWLIQGISEEFTNRGYLMVSLTTRYSVLRAILVNSTLFAAMHLLNPNVGPLPIVNVFLFGLFASFYLLYTDNIWGIGALHSVWNFAQGNIFGIPVSGQNGGPTILSSKVNSSMEWLNGGKFGLEGGIAVTIPMLIGITVLVILILRKQNRLK